MRILLASRSASEIRTEAQALLKSASVEGEILIMNSDGTLKGEVDGDSESDPGGAEVVLFSPSVPDSPPAMASLMREMNRSSVRWIQGPGAGIDNPLWQQFLNRGIRLTNASGIHADPIAQYIFTYILFWERNVARHLDQQARKHWEIIVSGDLTEKTLGIVGYGGIGAAAARVAKAFGMRTVGSRRTAVTDPFLDQFVATDALEELLSVSDYVLLCLPFNDQTRGTIGARELGAMRSDAVLINVARGGVVDEPALVRALQEKTIRGATLDVTSEEPLPADSPLWSMPNCVLTPHDAGYSPRSDERLARLFLENLELYLRGDRLVNEVTTTGINHS